jgi:hypothetical protein
VAEEEEELTPKINDGCTTITTPTEHNTCFKVLQIGV